MSRSYKQPLLKDKPRNYKRTPNYWRPIRRVQKQQVKDIGREYFQDKEFFYDYINIKQPKEIINDWVYCDIIYDYRFYNYFTKWWYFNKSIKELEEYRDKLKRK